QARIPVLALTLVCVLGVSAFPQNVVPGGGVSDSESSSIGSASSLSSDEPSSRTNDHSSGEADPMVSSGSGLAGIGAAKNRDTGIDWGHLYVSSMFFLAVSHSYRYANESTTQNAFHKPFFKDYASSVANLHGWNDGDPFMVNYVGHPMQGAVSNFIWEHNDR